MATVRAASAQQSSYELFRAHNNAMTDVQPAWMGPLIQSDSRLSQAIRLSVGSSFAPGQHAVNFGNGHGIGTIVARRFQFDFNPPSYIQNHSKSFGDGAGDASTQVKVRIASGNAEHGNYALTAIVTNSYPTGSYQNGGATAWFNTRLASGKQFGRFFDLQTTFGAAFPTGQIAAQGRAIEWNLTGQVHPNPHVWLNVENNYAYNVGGPFDGKTQNFITPAAFYLIKRKSWGPTHAAMVFDGGMQIATSSYHPYNHNLIAEMRILY